MTGSRVDAGNNSQSVESPFRLTRELPLTTTKIGLRQPVDLTGHPPATNPAITAPPIPPTWQLAVVSFLPVRFRDASHRWVGRVPLALILIFQLAMTLRLSNSAYRDEALYIWTGHRMIEHWRDGAVLYDNPSQYFSGSPSVYPVIAALLDDVGGLAAVRVFSLLCMLLATFAIYRFTSRLLDDRAGLAAALCFALLGPTQQLGHYATFDALALMLLAAGSAIGVRAAQTRRLGWAPVVGVLLAAAVASKYVSLLFVPFVLGTILLATPWRHAGRIDTKRVALLSFAAFVVALGALVLTVGRADFDGFLSTTSSRSGSSIVQPATAWDVAAKGMDMAGPWYVLITFGAVIAISRLRRYALTVLLVAGALIAILYQAYLGEAVSLEKHIAFGMIFGAPLIGILAMRTTQTWRTFVVAGAFVVLAIFGAATSAQIFSGWSNTTALTDVLAYKLRAAPYIRLLGEPYEPIRFAFGASTEYWQWDTTDPISALYYQPASGEALRGIEAAKAGLADGYWQVVYFDGSTGASQELEPLLPGYGYEMTDTVPLSNGHGPDVYRIWQKFN